MLQSWQALRITRRLWAIADCPSALRSGYSRPACSGFPGIRFAMALYTNKSAFAYCCLQPKIMISKKTEIHPQLKTTIEECDREPIHIPGTVQSFGCLVAFDQNQRITRASENVKQRFKQAASDLIGKPISSILHDSDAARIVHASDCDEVARLRRIRIKDGSDLYAFVHDAGAERYLDIVSHGNTYDPLESMQSFVDAVDSATTTNDCLNSIVRQLRKLTKFDRVKIYRFDKDWHGEVVAESRVDDIPSYLGLHFPESDIPRQARDLYLRNRIRVIGDVNDPQSTIIQQTGLEPLDLSFSFIRSVSPIHLQYLRNIDIASSTSISITRGGNLWGLITCHHRTPRQFTAADESFFRTLSTICSSWLSSLEQVELTLATRKSFDFLQKILPKLETETLSFLLQDGTAMDDLIRSAGVVVAGNGTFLTKNQVPDADTLARLVAWLEAREEKIFACDDLNIKFGAMDSPACGLLAAKVPNRNQTWLMWFRQEVIQEISWASDPYKPKSSSQFGERLYPRTSISIWKETKCGHSESWRENEINSATDLVNLLGISTLFCR